MSYESCALDGVFVVRWGKNPQLPDVERYANEIAAARTKQGKPLVGLFIMPPDSTAPDEAFRKAQAKKLPEIMENLQATRWPSSKAPASSRVSSAAR